MVKVFICVDASKYSDQAFDWYVKTIHNPQNSVVLIHCPEYYVHDFNMSPGVVEEMKKKVNKETEELKAKYEAKVKEVGIDAEFKAFHTMKCGETICKVAQEEQAELLVLGTRGLGTIRRTIMGSVSDFVVHHAHCPVLVCRH